MNVFIFCLFVVSHWKHLLDDHLDHSHFKVLQLHGISLGFCGGGKKDQDQKQLGYSWSWIRTNPSFDYISYFGYKSWSIWIWILDQIKLYLEVFLGRGIYLKNRSFLNIKMKFGRPPNFHAGRCLCNGQHGMATPWDRGPGRDGSVRWLGGISERGGYRNDDMRIGIFPSGYGNDWFLDHTYGNRTVCRNLTNSVLRWNWRPNSDVRKTTASGTLQRPTSLTRGRFFVHPRWTLGKMNLFWPSNWLTMCM